jgi:hypothetical protein
MARFFRLLAAGALATAAAPAAAFAGTPSLAERPAETVVTAFDPPLERPLTFRRSTETVRQGQTVSTWGLMEFVFSRREGGYRVRVRSLDGGISGVPPALERAYRNIALRFTVPYVLLLDQDGAIEGLENEEEVWAEMMRLTGEMVREVASGQGEAADGAIQAFLGTFRDSPREARLASLTEAVAPIVEYASVEVELGQPISAELESSDLLGTPVTFVVRIVPQRVEQGHLFLSVTASIPPEDLARIAENMVDRARSAAGSSASGSAAAQTAEAVRNVRMSRESEASYEVEVESGLTRRHRAVERILVTSEGRESLRTQTVIIDRVE